MLTNGLRVRNRAREQARLVAELADHGVAALGWAVGTVEAEIPDAVLREAERRSFPLLRVPIGTPFRHIVLFASQPQLSGDAYLFRRLQRMQEFLVDALAEPDPEDAVVRRLGSLLDVDVLLYRADGRVVARCGRAPEGPVWDALDRTSAARASGSAEQWRFAAEPVDSDGLIVRWLACASRTTPIDEQVAGALMRHAVRMLALLSGVSRFEERRERERRAALLRTLLDGEAEQTALAEEAEALGIASGRGELQVACCATGDTGSSAAALAAAMEAELRRQGIPWLLGTEADSVAVVLQADPASADTALARALRQLPHARAGLGEPVASLRDVAGALAQARLALTAIRPRDDQRVVRVADVDPVSWLLAAAPRGVYERRLAGPLEPLQDHPTLLHTLRCYFACDLSASRAARRLFLHPNSLRYRLARIEELLGTSLRSPQTIANVHLALLHDAVADRAVGERAQPARFGASIDARPSKTA